MRSFTEIEELTLCLIEVNNQLIDECQVNQNQEERLRNIEINWVTEWSIIFWLSQH